MKMKSLREKSQKEKNSRRKGEERTAKEEEEEGLAGSLLCAGEEAERPGWPTRGPLSRSLGGTRPMMKDAA